MSGINLLIETTGKKIYIYFLKMWNLSVHFFSSTFIKSSLCISSRAGKMTCSRIKTWQNDEVVWMWHHCNSCGVFLFVTSSTPLFSPPTKLASFVFKKTQQNQTSFGARDLCRESLWLDLMCFVGFVHWSLYCNVLEAQRRTVWRRLTSLKVLTPLLRCRTAQANQERASAGSDLCTNMN